MPEQKITVEEALRAYTQRRRLRLVRGDEKGTLEPGKLADLRLIDRDLRAFRRQTIRDARVVLTIVGGNTVFER